MSNPATRTTPQTDDSSSVKYLSGEWEFRLDPSDEGVAQSWFARQGIDFDRRIAVPGAWNAQGFGFPTASDLDRYEAQRWQQLAPLRDLRVLGQEGESERLFHVFPGPAWYRTTTIVPAEWAGRTTWLVLDGVHRTADVWIDGRYMGEHRSYLTPLRLDLTDIARSGDAIQIVVRVDARHDRSSDPLSGAMDLLDFVHAEWGGIYKHVYLETTGPLRLHEIFVTSSLRDRRIEVTAQAEHRSGGGSRATIEAVAEVENEAGDSIGRVTGTVANDGRISLDVPLSEVAAWTPATPNLYQLILTIQTEGLPSAAQRIRFGMRELTVEDGRFMLNGRPFFLRGYGDGSVFPNSIAPPVTPDEYQRRLMAAKELGFNYVRLHSWVPPEEYLEAADELGMFVQPEFPFAAKADLPATRVTREAALAQWAAVIRQYRNHPSIAAWSMGNELYGSFDLASEMYQLAKTLDPTRLVIDSDGSRLDEAHRPTLDFVAVPFAEDASIGFLDGKYELPEPVPKPIVAHEAGYFVTLPDPAEIVRYRSGVNPYWLRQAADRIAVRGLGGRYEDYLATSRRLQATCLKANIEAARRSDLSGISVWLLQDYPNCAEGVLDTFFGTKHLTAAEFRQFNSPTVLLLDVDRRNRVCGERFRVDLVVSCFEDTPTNAARLRWSLMYGDDTVSSGQQTALRLSEGVQPICSIELELPDLPVAAQLTFAAELDDHSLHVENHWDLWMYPTACAAEAEQPGIVGLDGTADLHPRLDPVHPDSLEPTIPLVVASQVTAKVLDYLVGGGRLLLLDPKGVFDTEKTTYRPAAWDGSGHFGLMFNSDHPALRAMPSNGWCDLQFYHLLQDSDSVMLDSFPEPIEPIVTCIDRPNRMAARSHLFEVRVGAGKLLVSGFGIVSAVQSGDPAAAFLLDQLIAYVLSSEFRPEGSIPTSAVHRVMHRTTAHSVKS